jgi:hypothetical protein
LRSVMTTAATISLIFVLAWLVANTLVFVLMLWNGARQ